VPGCGRHPRCPDTAQGRQGTGAMRVETTRTAGTVRLRHAVGTPARRTTSSPAPHRSSPPPRGRHEPVAWRCAAATARALAAVPPRAGLPGPTGGGTPRRRSPSRSGRTTPGRRCQPGGPENCGALARGRGGVTVIVEHDPDLDGLDGGFWTELDAALNVPWPTSRRRCSASIPSSPCTSRSPTAPGATTPWCSSDGALRHNPEHRAHGRSDRPRRRARARLLGPPDQRMGFDTWQLVEVRDTVAQAAHAAGCDRDRGRRPGAGGERGGDERRRARQRRRAPGPLDRPGQPRAALRGARRRRLLDPLPGLRAPHPSDPRGRGLWIARQLCDLLHVWGDHTGTHVRIRALP
jgi:hypothetical protein